VIDRRCILEMPGGKAGAGLPEKEDLSLEIPAGGADQQMGPNPDAVTPGE